MKITRRSAIGILASSVALEQQASAQTAADGLVDLQWLDGGAPGMEAGVTWGVPSTPTVASLPRRRSPCR